MTIKSLEVPRVRDGQALGLVGVDTGTVHDMITKDVLDAMDPWSLQESIQFRDTKLGALGVTEILELKPVYEATETYTGDGIARNGW